VVTEIVLELLITFDYKDFLFIDFDSIVCCIVRLHNETLGILAFLAVTLFVPRLIGSFKPFVWFVGILELGNVFPSIFNSEWRQFCDVHASAIEAECITQRVSRKGIVHKLHHLSCGDSSSS
jgi:hypothetical protein